MAEEEAVTISVKLKVHYTFDAEHKIDHLSRSSESIDVQTAPIDDATTIGIIDLRSCLDAVINSSPELTHFHEADYTVYAYDYSEPNTPLVGQGMLSKVLSQERDSEAMVTGKIMKSAMAKFKKNAEPFLEVKLRFTPIASPIQRGRTGSMSSMTEGLQGQWSGFAQVASMGLDRPQSPADMSRLDNVHRTLHEGGTRRESTYNNSFPYSTSRPSSRPGTPTNGQQYLHPQPGSTHSRQNSYYQQSYTRRDSDSGYFTPDEGFEDGPARKRAKVTKVGKAKKSDFNIEQQPSSLRNAAMGASSLRIHHPTPVNPTAALQRGLSTEEPVRPPTPMAGPGSRKPASRPRGRPRKHWEVETVEPSSPTISDLPQPQILDPNISSPEETRDRIPNESVTSTPANLPSSPPLMPNNVAATSPELPGQPSTSVHTSGNHDSGFFSAQVEDAQVGAKGPDANDIFGDFADFDFAHDDISRLWDDKLTAPTTMIGEAMDAKSPEQHYTPVFDEESIFGGPTPQPEAARMPSATPQPESQPQQPLHHLPQQIPIPTLQQNPHSQPRTRPQDHFQRPSLPSSAQQSMSNDKNGRSIPALLPRPPTQNLHRSQSILPTIPASDPGIRTLQRSNTWAPDMSDAIMSDAMGPDGSKRSRKRPGKEQTKARLESAIATGEMPPFCHNCGAIETPAWRRGYIKHFTCAYDSIQTSLDPGEMCYKEMVEKNADGSVKLWKGWKVEKNKDDHQEWVQINLCNPCGLWFHKQKTPRPPEKWQKKDPKEKRKRKRPPKPPKSRTQPGRAAAGTLHSDAMQSDAQEPQSEDSSPADTSVEDGPDDNNDTITVDEDNDNDNSDGQELPSMPRSMSAQLGRRTVMFADVDIRQVKSSPVVRGTADEPITLDTPSQPLRRVLFPTPDRSVAEQSIALIEKTNESLLPSFARRSPRLNKIRDVFQEAHLTAAVTVELGDKENITPGPAQLSGTEDFGAFLNDNDDTLLPPSTPTPKRRSERILQRTPGKTPSREFGAEMTSNVQPSSHLMKTPKQDNVFDVGELFMDTVMRNMDPQFMTPHTRRMYAACSDAATPISRRSQRARTGFTPKGNTPGRKSSAMFDFPDLPTLKTSSPMSHDHVDNAFSELPTERLFSEYDDAFAVDKTMPSSPPLHGEWHDGFDDMFDYTTFDGTKWDDVEEPGSASKLRTPKKQRSNGFLGVETPEREGLRRSPRRVARDN